MPIFVDSQGEILDDPLEHARFSKILDHLGHRGAYFRGGAPE